MALDMDMDMDMPIETIVKAIGLAHEEKLMSALYKTIINSIIWFGEGDNIKITINYTVNVYRIQFCTPALSILSRAVN